MGDPQEETLEEEEEAEHAPVVQEEAGEAASAEQPSSNEDRPQIGGTGKQKKTVAWVSVVDFDGDLSNFHIHDKVTNNKAKEMAEEEQENLLHWGWVDRSQPPRYGHQPPSKRRRSPRDVRI